VITSSKGWVFGGYAAVAWVRPSNSDGIGFMADDSGESFLFSLINPHNAPPAKFGLKDKRYALLYDPSYGPCFGGGGGEIHFDGDSNSIDDNWTRLGSWGTYSNPTGLDGTTVFTGQCHFRAREVEVYAVQ
jgi:hypothetical protein